MTNERKLTVVVIGATGNVGTSVVTALGEHPAVSKIVGIARRPTPWRPPKTTFRTADVTVDDLRHLVRGADVVIHLAWLFQPTHDPAVTWRNNVLGGIRVFEAVADEQVPALVYASSVAAYSPGPSDREVDEDWPTHGWPGAAYPREKAYVERWLDTFEVRHPEVRTVRLRPGFLFKRASATEQRRLFIGPLLPRRLVRPDLLPIVPDIHDLRVQVAHTDDVARAYVQAALRDVRGAINVAAEPPVDGPFLAGLFDARTIGIPRAVVKAALTVAWNGHLVPASPGLFDTVLQLPLMSTDRARTQLDWQPAVSPADTLREFLTGLRDGAGTGTSPLLPDSLRTRLHELRTGVGSTA